MLFFPSCTEPRGAAGLAEHPGGLGRGRLRCAEGSSRESVPFPCQAGTALAPPQLSVFKTSLCWLLLTVCAGVDCKQPNPFAPANHLCFCFFFSEKLKAGAPTRRVCLLSEMRRRQNQSRARHLEQPQMAAKREGWLLNQEL